MAISELWLSSMGRWYLLCLPSFWRCRFPLVSPPLPRGYVRGYCAVRFPIWLSCWLPFPALFTACGVSLCWLLFWVGTCGLFWQNISVGLVDFVFSFSVVAVSSLDSFWLLS